MTTPEWTTITRPPAVFVWPLWMVERQWSQRVTIEVEIRQKRKETITEEVLVFRVRPKAGQAGRCSRCRRVVAQVPWARPGAKCTTLFEDTCAWLAAHTALSVLTVLFWRSARTSRRSSSPAGSTEELGGTIGDYVTVDFRSCGCASVRVPLVDSVGVDAQDVRGVANAVVEEFEGGCGWSPHESADCYRPAPSF